MNDDKAQVTENPAFAEVHITNQHGSLTPSTPPQDMRVKINARPEEALSALLKTRPKRPE